MLDILAQAREGTGAAAAGRVFGTPIEQDGVIVIPVAMVLFHVSIPAGWLAALTVTFLGTFGFVTLGTFYAAMSSRSRAREVLLPLLLFPMLIPVLLGAVQASTSLLAGDPMHERVGIAIVGVGRSSVNEVLPGHPAS